MALHLQIWGGFAGRRADLTVLHELGESSSDGRLHGRALLGHVAALWEAHLCAIVHSAVQQQIAPAPHVLLLQHLPAPPKSAMRHQKNIYSGTSSG